MRVNLPHIGEIDVCVDDSCDGSHCMICGCHFMDWYTSYTICSHCELLTPEQQEETQEALQKIYDKVWGDDDYSDSP